LGKEQSIDLPDVNLTEIVENFGSEQATFNSYLEFAAFTKKFKEISYEEQQELISKLKYETIEEILDRAYEGMNNLKTRDEFIEYLKQYESYLELVELPNGEEEVQEKEITGHYIYSFLNKDKIIKIGNIYQKYFSKLCVESDSKETLLKIENERDVINSGLKYYVSYTTEPSELNKDALQLRWGEIGFFRQWEKENDKYWCKNKRKVRLKVGFPYEVVLLINPRGEGPYIHQVFVGRRAKVTALRKGIACIWYKYKTKIIWNDFHIEYDTNWNGDIEHFVWTHPDEVKYARSINREKLLQVYIAEWQFYDTQMTKIKSNITTRGIWDKWLKVDWHN
jgi:hypothetical protein